MRNMAEQKKIAAPIIALVFMIVLFAVVFVIFYLNVFSIDANIAGYRFYDFADEVEEINPYYIDEGDVMKYIEKSSKVLVKTVAVEELKENDVIAYYYKEDQITPVIKTQILKGVSQEGEVTVYYTHDLDNAERHSTTIESGRLMGVYVTHIPKIGIVSQYLAANNLLKIGSLVVLALLMFGIPITVLVVRIKRRNLGSPFPEGVNLNRLKTENLYIYQQIKEFVQSAGMKVEKGYDCDLLYVGSTLFGILHCTNGNMYVNINKNFQRYDNKIDRAGYICIPHAANLESAKKRINSIYRAYFMDKRSRRRRPQRG